MKKEMTIEDLAIITQKGFDEVDKRFTTLESNINERFEKIDKKFEKIDGQFEKIDKRLDIIELKLIDGRGREIDQLRDRMRIVETKLTKL